ncbi:MAG: hypothetical protein P1U63_12915 [Coxiellaceae bacterium]|nr:hypothetical protein [Coxiellaceae bacterium]
MPILQSAKDTLGQPKVYLPAGMLAGWLMLRAIKSINNSTGGWLTTIAAMVAGALALRQLVQKGIGTSPKSEVADEVTAAPGEAVNMDSLSPSQLQALVQFASHCNLAARRNQAASSSLSTIVEGEEDVSDVGEVIVASPSTPATEPYPRSEDSPLVSPLASSPEASSQSPSLSALARSGLLRLSPVHATSASDGSSSDELDGYFSPAAAPAP